MNDDARLLVNEVRDALLNGELFLEYLPTVDLQNGGRCVGAEALVRWRRGEKVIMPMQFIPSIEGTPVAGLLTYWVIDTVETELGAWLRQHPHAHLSINVPPEILGRGGLEYAARKSRLIDVRQQIILEITERGIPDAVGLEELKDLASDSVRIALDDVGMDDSNLLVLFQTPVDVLKLDKRVVDDIDAPDSQGLLAGLSPLIRASQRVVVAEGIEHPEQANLLRESGIAWGQGWLYSKALPAQEFITWHASHQ